MWFLLTLISGLSAATLAIVIKLHLKEFNPLLMTIIFSVITVIVLLAVDIATQRQIASLPSLTHKDWITLLIAGSLNALGLIAYFWALSLGKASSVVVVDRLSILYVVIFSILFLQEPFTLRAIIGALFMIAGAICITG